MQTTITTILKTTQNIATSILPYLFKVKSLLPFWPYAAIILAHTIWGANFLIAKVTLEEFPPMSLAFLRFVLAILLLFPFLLSKHTNQKKLSTKDMPKILLIGILMVTLNISLFYEGLKRTTITDSSVLMMSIPFMSVLIGWWFLKESIYIINLIGILLGLIGVFFILGVPAISLDSKYTPDQLVGNILTFLAALTWVLGAAISKTMLKKYSALTITAVIFLVGIVTFFVPAAAEYIRDPAWISKITPLGILGLIYIAAASSVSAYFLFEWALQRLGMIKVDLFQYMEPIIATSLGILVLSEKIELSFVIGAIFICIGAFLGTIAQKRHHKAHRT